MRLQPVASAAPCEVVLLREARSLRSTRRHSRDGNRSGIWNRPSVRLDRIRNDFPSGQVEKNRGCLS